MEIGSGNYDPGISGVFSRLYFSSLAKPANKPSISIFEAATDTDKALNQPCQRQIFEVGGSQVSSPFHPPESWTGH